jgi:hypothetical protein
MTRTYSDAVVVSTLVVISIVAVVIGVIVGRSAASPQTPPKAKDRTRITLSDGPNGCRPDPNVGMLAQYQGKHVVWNVVNNCSTGYFVKVYDFKLRDADNGNVPATTPTQVLDNPNDGITTQAIAGRGMATLDAKLKKDVPEGVYKYVIAISTTGEPQSYTDVLDPDVDPWP